MYPPMGRMRLALVLFLLVLIVILSVLIVVLLLVLVLVVVLIVLVVLIFVLVVVLHNEHSFFVIWKLRTHYAPHHSDLCVFPMPDCHARWSSKAYRKDANATVDAMTVGTLIHQIHG